MPRKDEKLDKKSLTIISTTDYFKRTTIEDFDLVELQKPIFIKGKLVYDDPDIIEKRKYCDEQMKKLYPEVKRIKMPHEYYVDGTEEYIDFKNDMIMNVTKLVKRK